MIKIARILLLLACAAFAESPQPIDGWKMELMLAAPAIRHPSVVCAAPDGRVFVAEDPMDISTPKASEQLGRILCLHPDGRLTTFAEKLHAVFGMQYLEGQLYVLHNPKFSVFRDDQGIGRDRRDLIEQTNPEPWALDWNDHIPAGFRLGMDGYFYLAVGDKGLYGAVDQSGQRVDLHGGGVVRIRPDGTGLEIHSTGVRNILDVAIDAEDEIFTYDNTDEHDWMGRATHMVAGGFYGYPYDFVPRQPYTLWMLADYGPGAACGTLCWNNDSLPEEWRGNLILSDFGQRNLRSVRLAREGATFKPVAEQLLFPNPPSDFRPVGICETTDGRGFYICDWQHSDTKAQVTVGRLWKLAAKFADGLAPLPAWYPRVATGDAVEVATTALLAGLEHPRREVRLTAQRALSRREEARAELLMLLQNPQTVERARTHALWALAGKESPVTPGELPLAAAPVALRRQILRFVGEHKMAIDVASYLRDADASVRFQAATALRRQGDPAAIDALLTALGEPDLFTRHAVFVALRALGQRQPNLWPKIVAALESPHGEVASFAMREVHDAALAKALADMAAAPARPSGARVAALRLLAGSCRQRPAWKGEWWTYHPALGQPPAKSLAWEGTPIALAALRSALEDPLAEIRRVAAAGLSEASDLESAPLVRERFGKEADLETRRGLLGCLAALGDGNSAKLIIELLRAPEANQKLLFSALEAAATLAEKTDQKAALAEALANVLADEPLPVESKTVALRALGKCQVASVLPSVLALAKNEDMAISAAAFQATVAIGGEPAKEGLLVLLRQDFLPSRRQAALALGRLKNRSAVEDLLLAWKEEDTREAATEALAVLPDIRALDAYLTGLGGNMALREKCRFALAGIATEALPKLEERRAALSPELLAELRRAYEKDAKALASPLFAEAPRALQPSDYASHALANTGDAWRGQQVFFDTNRVACITCHAVTDFGGKIGPNLTTAGAQFGRDALIDAILYPSKAVREGYQQFVLETQSGEVVAGAIRAETNESITVADIAGRLQTVAKANLKARHASERSLMPEGLHSLLSREEFTDLIAYLQSMRMDPRRSEPAPLPAGFQPLFNGKDLEGWKTSPHWTARAGLLEHDGVADDLWHTRELGDFVLRLEWRWPGEPAFAEHPVINADGHEAKQSDGQAIRQRVLEAGDSGVFLRGLYKAQANLFCYPVGSGEFWEYRESLAGEERRALTPRVRADRPIGHWNEMEITVRGERLTVILNGQEVLQNARLPGLPARGPIGLQHEHGRLQLRALAVRELP